MDLSGSSTLVTGGASGLGRATAEALAGRGAFVTIVDLPASSGAEYTPSDLVANCAVVPVASFRNATVAPAIAAPDGSVTVPVSPVACA